MVTAKSWTEDTNVDGGMTLCDIERVDSGGQPWIRMPTGQLRAARATNAVTHAELSAAAQSGYKAAVAILSGTGEPIVFGIIATNQSSEVMNDSCGVVASVDGERVTLKGHKEIVLQCGSASITLTNAGKILLRGTYVSSRSSGVNRIKGGSVQIN